MPYLGPVILYDNILERSGVSITATSTADGYSVANLADRMLFTKWRSGGSGTLVITVDLGAGQSAVVDAWAISGHNLYTQTGTFTSLEFSDDGSAWTLSSDMAVLYNSRNDRSRMYTVSGEFETPPAAHRYHRITFGGVDSYLEIGALCMGARLDLPEYLALGYDPLALDVKMQQARSRGGSFIGSVVETVTQQVDLKFSESGFVSSSFFATTGTPSWDGFLRTCWTNGKPFWFSAEGAPDTSAFVDVETECLYAFPRASAKHASPWISGTQRSLKFSFDALVEGYQA